MEYTEEISLKLHLESIIKIIENNKGTNFSVTISKNNEIWLLSCNKIDSSALDDMLTKRNAILFANKAN